MQAQGGIRDAEELLKKIKILRTAAVQALKLADADKVPGKQAQIRRGSRIKTIIQPKGKTLKIRLVSA